MSYVKMLLKHRTGYDGHLLGKAIINLAMLFIAWNVILFLCLDRNNGVLIFAGLSFVATFVAIMINEIIPGADIMWHYIYYKEHYENMSNDIARLSKYGCIRYYEDHETEVHDTI